MKPVIPVHLDEPIKDQGCFIGHSPILLLLRQKYVDSALNKPLLLERTQKRECECERETEKEQGRESFTMSKNMSDRNQINERKKGATELRDLSERERNGM